MYAGCWYGGGVDLQAGSMSCCCVWSVTVFPSQPSRQVPSWQELIFLPIRRLLWGIHLDVCLQRRPAGYGLPSYVHIVARRMERAVGETEPSRERQPHKPPRKSKGPQLHTSVHISSLQRLCSSGGVSYLIRSQQLFNRNVHPSIPE